MAEVVGVRFKENGKVYYFDPDSKAYSKNEKVIVETVRGIECGEVATVNHKINDAEILHPLKKVIRAATEADLKIVNENEKKAKDWSVYHSSFLQRCLLTKPGGSHCVSVNTVLKFQNRAFLHHKAAPKRIMRVTLLKEALNPVLFD